MKTTLRYLLIATAMVGFLSANAQETTKSWGQLPETQMKSTSTMVGSGSTLPLAAKDCDCFIFTDEAPSARQGAGNSRKGRPGDWTDPYKDPLGDAAIPLALCALAYVLARAIHKKTRVSEQRLRVKKATA